jgi:putative transcriptional regulator
MGNWKRNRLRVLRAERRMTQRDVADKVGVSVSQISIWENAHEEPTDVYKAKIAKALRVPLSAIEPGEEAKAS